MKEVLKATPGNSKTKAVRRKGQGPVLPHPTDWRTTDADEILKRQLRAREERHRIANLDSKHPVFSNFEVKSPSGMTYQVEIRDLLSRQFSCTCTDFRINGLGTCKHVEAVLLQLARRHRAEFKAAQRVPSARIDIVPDPSTGCLRVERGFAGLPSVLRSRFDADGLQLSNTDPEDLVRQLEASCSPAIRTSQEVTPWLDSRRRIEERILLRRDYEAGVHEGRHPEHVTLSPLFSYQREGMLHLAFGERALLADEMGLGKTIQAIAACALLHHLGKARRVLIVTPASLKTEWEEQIRKFTTLPLRLVFGGRAQRARLYAEPDPPLFTIANYEQVAPDSLDLNQRLRPDIIVLDEAQRIKNWSTRIAQAVKRLSSRYAFVLTGTPSKTGSTNSVRLSTFSTQPFLVRYSASTANTTSSTTRAARRPTRTSTNSVNAFARSFCGAAKPTLKPSCPIAPTVTSSFRLPPLCGTNTRAMKSRLPISCESPNAVRSPQGSRIFSWSS
jgi:SNF2-related domain